MIWKKIFIIAIALALVVGCGSKKDKDMPQGEVFAEERFFPLPEFSQLFGALDYLQTANYDAALPDTYLNEVSDVYIASYYLGNLTADAVVAVKARNKTKLTAIANAMISCSKMVGISEEVLMLADELLILIQNDQWDDLQIALETYKKRVEISLYDTQQFDFMTLMQAGGWTAGINTMSYLLIQNYREDTSAILKQTGTINNVSTNLSKMTNNELYETTWFTQIVTAFEKMGEIVKTENETFTQDEIKILYEITNIIATF